MTLMVSIAADPAPFIEDDKTSLSDNLEIGGPHMNTICQHLDNVCGVHLVKARTPGGRYILVCHKGTREEAIKKAILAELKPA